MNAPDESDGSSDGAHDGRGASEAAAVTRLRKTLSAVAGGSGSRRDLEQAACALLSQLRYDRGAPEQMLLRIKAILAEAGLRPSYAGTSNAAMDSDAALYRDVIAWCIDHHYRDGHRCK